MTGPTTAPMSTEVAQATSIATKSTSKHAGLRLMMNCIPHGARGWQLALADEINKQAGGKVHGRVHHQFAPMLAWLPDSTAPL